MPVFPGCPINHLYYKGENEALSAGVFSCDTPPAGIIPAHPPGKV